LAKFTVIRRVSSRFSRFASPNETYEGTPGGSSAGLIKRSVLKNYAISAFFAAVHESGTDANALAVRRNK
jgi:hypothetical protein